MHLRAARRGFRTARVVIFTIRNLRRRMSKSATSTCRPATTRVRTTASWKRRGWLQDGNAVFGLAESARGLNKTEEAITNYDIYLQAFPKGKKTKDAEKALAELTSPRKK